MALLQPHLLLQGLFQLRLLLGASPLRLHLRVPQPLGQYQLHQQVQVPQDQSLPQVQAVQLQNRLVPVALHNQLLFPHHLLVHQPLGQFLQAQPLNQLVLLGQFRPVQPHNLPQLLGVSQPVQLLKVCLLLKAYLLLALLRLLQNQHQALVRRLQLFLFLGIMNSISIL